MSSGRVAGWCVVGGGVLLEGPVGGVGGVVDAEMGDGDAVEGGVGLPVASPVESVPLGVGGSDGDWVDAGPRGEPVGGGEAADVDGFSEELPAVRGS